MENELEIVEEPVTAGNFFTQISLPPEVLAICFDYLSTEDLASVIQTCKQFRDAVDIMPKVCSKFPLVITEKFKSNDYIQEVVKNSRFEYETLVVRYFNEKCNVLIKRYTNTITELRINMPDLNLDIVSTLFFGLPKVEKLVIQTSALFENINHSKFRNVENIFPKLKSLEYFSDCPELLNLLRHTKIEYFSCYMKDSRAFWRFIRKQKQLKKLIIWKDVFYQNTSFQMIPIETLIINEAVTLPNVNFLHAFKSLKTLTKFVYAANKPTEDLRVFETVFNEMTNLREVYLNITDETFDTDNAFLQKYFDRCRRTLIPDDLYDRVGRVLMVNMQAYFIRLSDSPTFLERVRQRNLPRNLQRNQHIKTFITNFRDELFMQISERILDMSKFVVMFFGRVETGRAIMSEFEIVICDTYSNWLQQNDFFKRLDLQLMNDWLRGPVENSIEHVIFRGIIIPSTERLTLYGSNTSENIQKIVKIYPNLVQLKLLKQTTTNDDLMEFLATYLEHLKEFTLDSTEDQAMWIQNCKFRNLKRLNFKLFRLKSDALLNFFNGNSQIEYLILENCSNLTDFVFEEIAKCLDGLTHLEILGVNKLTDRAIDIILMHFPALTYLRIHRKSFQQFSDFRRLYEKNGVNVLYKTNSNL